MTKPAAESRRQVEEFVSVVKAAAIAHGIETLIVSAGLDREEHLRSGE